MLVKVKADSQSLKSTSLIWVGVLRLTSVYSINAAYCKLLHADVFVKTVVGLQLGKPSAEARLISGVKRFFRPKL